MRPMNAIMRSKLHPTSKCLAKSLLDYGAGRRSGCRRSTKNLAADLGLSVRTVQRHLGYLELNSRIEVHREHRRHRIYFREQTP